MGRTKIKVTKGNKHFLSITVPFGKCTEDVLFGKRSERWFEVYKDGIYIDSTRMNDLFVKDMESIGFVIIPKHVERPEGLRQIEGYSVYISKIPNQSKPKEISVLFASDNIDTLKLAKDTIIEYIKDRCDVMIKNDMWKDNCEVLSI